MWKPIPAQTHWFARAAACSRSDSDEICRYQPGRGDLACGPGAQMQHVKEPDIKQKLKNKKFYNNKKPENKLINKKLHQKLKKIKIRRNKTEVEKGV